MNRFKDFFKSVETKTVFWKNTREMQKVIHNLPEPFQALVLELEEISMSKQEIESFVKKLEQKEFDRRHKHQKFNLNRGLEKCITLKVLIIKDGRYFLTKGGKEIAEHFKKVIPFFFKFIFSIKTVSKITIVIHIILSIIKFLFGFISLSNGLIADGIDNSIDTVASIGIWFGIKFKRERIVSLIIIILMFVSVISIFFIGITKIINPVPVNEGLISFIISLFCGLVMLGLSAYQYLAGKKTSNFAILCQAVDSKNHFFTSLFVCLGIGLSYIGDFFKIPFFYYGDALASFFIGILILKSVIELIFEFIKGGQAGTSNIKHFIGTSIISAQRKLILNWLSRIDTHREYTEQELIDMFENDFIKDTPKLLKLVNLEFHNISRENLKIQLASLAKAGKIRLKNDSI